MAKMENPYVKCPFYKWEEGLKLCCCYEEGVTVTYQSSFVTKQQRLEYEKRFCKRQWNTCPLAKALIEGENNV